MPLDLPPSLSLNQLEASSDEYQVLKPEWERISLFYSGGYQLRLAAEQFIRPRVGEEPALYRERLSKFSYRNIFSSAIRLQVSRMSNSPIYLEAEQADEAWWESFRENTNQKGRTERGLASDIFRDLLKFKTVWLHIDRPASAIRPLNRAQEQMLGLEPYINLYSPLEVINWDESDDPTWVKLRQMSKLTDPFGKSRDIITWTFITDREVAKYTAVVEIKNGKLLGYYDASGTLITDGDKPDIPLVSEPIIHNLGIIPVVKVDLPDDLWVGDEASILAYKHLRLSCHQFDIETLAYLQRFYSTEPAPDNDFSTTSVDDDPPEFGMQYIPKLEAFEWSEPHGHILPHLSKDLEDTERAIKESIALMGASASPAQSVTEQSGLSKSMDYVLSDELLQQYGSVITDAIQDAYQLIQRFRGRTPETISVAGLSDFEIRGFESLVARLTALSAIDMTTLGSNISPALLTIVRERIATELIGNLTPEQKAQIAADISNQPEQV